MEFPLLSFNVDGDLAYATLRHLEAIVRNMVVR